MRARGAVRNMGLDKRDVIQCEGCEARIQIIRIGEAPALGMKSSPAMDMQKKCLKTPWVCMSIQVFYGSDKGNLGIFDQQDSGSPSLFLEAVFGQRMSGVVNLRQGFEVEVRIALGGGNTAVAQQFLHAAQIGPALQKVGGV